MVFVKVTELTFGGFQRDVMTFLLLLKYRKLLWQPLTLCVYICVYMCMYFQVHNSCKEQMGKVCPLGQYRVSIIPPTALNSIDSDGETPSDTHTLSSVSTVAQTVGSFMFLFKKNNTQRF